MMQSPADSPRLALLVTMFQRVLKFLSQAGFEASLAQSWCDVWSV